MFQLPISTHRFPTVVTFLLSKCHETWVGHDTSKAAWAWASSLGPSIEQCNTSSRGPVYGASVRERALRFPEGDWDERIRLYREGLLTGRWRLGETLRDYAVADPTSSRRKFQCPASIVFGKNDPALYYRICVEGVEEHFQPAEKHLGSQSHVQLIEDCGHWSPLEEKGREVIMDHLERLLADAANTKA